MNANARCVGEASSGAQLALRKVGTVAVLAHAAAKRGQHKTRGRVNKKQNKASTFRQTASAQDGDDQHGEDTIRSKRTTERNSWRRRQTRKQNS